MSVIAYEYKSKFGWTGPGYEYPLMWVLIMVAIVLRGGRLSRSTAGWVASSESTRSMRLEGEP